MSVNKAILIGNLTKNPEVRTAQNGSRLANLSLATNESWKDKGTGEKKERVEYHRVTIFGDGLVNVLEQYTSKGDKLYIEGQIRTRKWQDQSGADKYSTEIIVQGFGGTVKIISNKQEAQSNPKPSHQPQSGMNDIDDFDSDVPF